MQMKQISSMELLSLFEALEIAREEITAAEDDGWVVTTDVHKQIADSKMLIHSVRNSPDLEMG